MSDIILPGAIDIRDPEHLTPERLREVEIEQEKAAINAEIAGRLFPLKPYRPDAPVCDTAWWQNVDGVHTKHHDVIKMPTWSHGRCVGPACVRFVAGLNVCGRTVQDYAAAVQLGVMTENAAREAVRAAAKPPEDSNGD